MLYFFCNFAAVMMIKNQCCYKNMCEECVFIESELRLPVAAERGVARVLGNRAMRVEQILSTIPGDLIQNLIFFLIINPNSHRLLRQAAEIEREINHLLIYKYSRDNLNSRFGIT